MRQRWHASLANHRQLFPICTRGETSLSTLLPTKCEPSQASLAEGCVLERGALLGPCARQSVWFCSPPPAAGNSHVTLPSSRVRQWKLRRRMVEACGGSWHLAVAWRGANSTPWLQTSLIVTSSPTWNSWRCRPPEAGTCELGRLAIPAISPWVLEHEAG